MTMTGANHAVRPKCPVEIQLDIHVTVRAAHLATQGRCHAGAMIDAPRYEAQHYCVAAEQLLAAAAATPSPRADPQGVMKLRSAKQQLGAKLSPARTIARAGKRRLEWPRSGHFIVQLYTIVPESWL